TVGVEESIKGLFEAPVYNIPYRDIGKVVSNHDPQVQIKTKESILKHEEVAEKLMDKFTVLPMRLYTVFSKKEEMLLKVKDHYEDFKENLDRVRDKCEYGIKVIWPGNIIKERIINAHKNESALTNPTQSGAKFMKEKFEKYKIDKEFEEEADRCIAIVGSFLNRLTSERKLEKLKTDNLLLSAAYLVDNEKRDDFKKAFDELKGSGGDLKFMLSGPWPAYNFITLNHSEAWAIGSPTTAFWPGDGKFGGPDLIETILQHKDPEEKDEK
ncbi:MAG: GvpL/GvpF family gas vesicle protein, partial [Candidatus Omnitrophota bacterium]|nr:GvpL/GvpF family gas vesicle protein [Candidatus Omnitrophota bacterium]